VRKSNEKSPHRPARPSARGRQLLDGLEEIILREGFRRVRIGELAARLHCSRQTLYQLAASKEELVLLVVDRVLRRIRRMGTDAASARRDVRDRIVALVEPGVSELRQASSLFLADVASFPPTKRLLEQHQRARREELQRLLEEGIRVRAFRGIDSRLAAEVIMAAVQRVMDSNFLVDVGLSAGDAIRGAEDLLLHGLLHLDELRTRNGDRARRRANSADARHTIARAQAARGNR
jgi:AcrR family transcriptional regulator